LRKETSMKKLRFARMSVVLLACVACGTAQSAPPTTQGVPADPAVPPPTQGVPADPTLGAATAFPPVPQSAPVIGSCPVFPLNNVWNTPVDTLPVDARSAQYIASIGAGTGLHPDFGAAEWDGGPIGIPFVVVPQSQTGVTISFVEYDDESDHGLYPIPASAPREFGGDHHVLVVREGECKLYELYHAEQINATTWEAGSGAVYDLRSNAMRPAGWTSADAAGLPILPGLVRYEEVAAGEIKHALRFTVDTTRDEYVWPARHQAGSTGDLNVPPMGQRFRLKASFDITPYDPQVQVILRAMQKYGLIIADNGSDWYLSGAPNASWNDDALVDQLGDITGANFEAVDVSSLIVDEDSAEVTASAAPQDRILADRGAALDTQAVRFAITLPGRDSAMTVNNTLPAELNFVPGSLAIAPASLPAPSFSGGTISWSGPLPSSQMAVISYQTTVNTSQRRAIINSASIAGSSGPTHLVTTKVIVNGLRAWLPRVRR
jgi:hypothetical protein